MHPLEVLRRHWPIAAMLLVLWLVVSGLGTPISAQPSSGDVLRSPLAQVAGAPALPAAPLKPSSFYGTLKQAGANVPDGTLLSVWIGSTKITETLAFTATADTVFRLDVPADDQATLAVEGGREGQKLFFKAAGVYVQSALWNGGTYQRLDLVVGPDADGDGWATPLDCNDNNPAVHPGQYEIVGNGIDDDCNAATPDTGSPPTVGFIANPMPAIANQPVQFSDASTGLNGPIVSWAWDFQNNGSIDSTAQNPSFSYSASGTYSVSLSVADIGGRTASGLKTLRVMQPPAAAFTYAPTPLLAGAAAHFSDHSTAEGKIVAWAWQFGDGAKSTQRSPDHTYNTAGSYTVTLTVNDDAGLTNGVAQTVTVIGPPAAAAAANAAASAAAGLGDTALQASLADLAVALDGLEQGFTSGCPQTLRDRAAAALQAVADRLAAYPLLTSRATALAATAGALRAHTICSDILSDLTGLQSTLNGLGDELRRLGAHRATVVLEPGVNATFVSVPVTYSVRVKNAGHSETTYGLSVQGIDPALLSRTSGIITLGAGQESTWTFSVTPNALGTLPFTVAVAAADDPFLHFEARGTLRVVDAFIRVTEVTADPPSVEAGNNSVALYASIANVANIYQTGRAEVKVVAPDGTSMYTSMVPLTMTAAFRWLSYPLGSVSVAGWNTGTYSVTVRVVDDAGRLIPDGTGSGTVVVGQGLRLSAAVTPQVVAPGTINVTTVITTERTGPVEGGPVAGLNNVYTFYLPADSGQGDHGDGFYIVGLRPTTQYQAQRFDEPTGSWGAVITDTVVMDDVKLYFDGFTSDQLYRVYSDNPLLIVLTSGEGSLVSAATPDLKFRGRHFTFVGDYAGVLRRSRATIFALESSTAVTVEVKPYDGAWGTPNTRVLEADGYWFFDQSTSGTTIMRVTADKDVLVYRNSADNDELDTVMADNGTPYGTTFHFAPVPSVYQDTFLLYNTGPLTANVTIYDIGVPASPAIAWQGTVPPQGGRSAIPSRGDFFKIVSDQTIAANGGGVEERQLQPGSTYSDSLWEISGIPVGNRYLYQTNILYSRGLHLRDEYTEFETGPGGQVDLETALPIIDKSTSNIPYANGLDYLATAPFKLTLDVTNVLPAGLFRHEENFGLAYSPTPWSRYVDKRASRGYYSGSSTAGQSASLTFDGVWVGLGFLADPFGGRAEVFIDGVSQGVVDTYSRYANLSSVYYRGLVSGTHTISVTVLGTHHPNSSGNWVRLDYVDTFNGDSPLGRFEEYDRGVIATADWYDNISAAASGGHYYRSGTAVWYGFAGDSVTYQAMAGPTNGEVEVLIDGQVQGRVSLWSATLETRAFSFGNLGGGPHVLQVRAYRGAATVDAFITPGIAPFYQVPVRTGVVRYEEDDSALSYDGVPYAKMPQAWATQPGSGYSDGYAVSTNQAGLTVSLMFTGTWAGLGYLGNTASGQVEVFVDGVSQGVIDGYTPSDTPRSAYYGGLAPGTHTLSVRTLGTRNPSSTGSYFRFDYFDAWDGTAMPEGRFETPSAATNDWYGQTSSVASGGSYYRSGTAMWYAFTSDSVTYQALLGPSNGQVEVSINSVTRGVVSLYSATVVTSTFNYTGLGAGPHVLQVRAYQGAATVDAFVSPVGSDYTPLLASTGVPLFASAPDTGGATINSTTNSIAASGDELAGTPILTDSVATLAPATAAAASVPVNVALSIDGAALSNIVATGVYTITLPAGRHKLGFAAEVGNVTLTGFQMQSSSSLVWSLKDVPPEAFLGPWSQKFWSFLSNRPFHFRQGGSGNCWIHTIPPYDYGQRYGIDLLHTVPITDVAVLPGTFSTPPLTVTQGLAATGYGWRYDQIPTEPVHTISFEATLAGMKPGETRRVSDGTDVRYTTLGGVGQAHLGPLYVSAAHLIAIDPSPQTANPGADVGYTVTLQNLGTASDTFTVTLSGLPDGWAAAPFTVTLAPGEQRAVPVTVRVPATARLADYHFAAVAQTSAGASDAAGALLSVTDLLRLQVAPEAAPAHTGDLVSYAVTITNLDTVARSYDLSPQGLAPNGVVLPSSVSVSGGGVATVPLQVTVAVGPGLYPFTVKASAVGGTANATDAAVLVVPGDRGVAAGLSPSPSTGAADLPVLYSLAVTNTGTLADTYSFGVAVPPGWDYQLEAKGEPLAELSLSSRVFNTADLSLFVTPPPGTTPGSYNFTVTVQSKNDPNVRAIVSGTLIVAGPANRPPSANAGGPYVVDEGGSVLLKGSGSDPDGDTVAFAWDLDGDNVFEMAGQQVTLSAAGRDGPASQQVTLRVCDVQNACATAGVIVDIANVAPTATFNAPALVGEGSSFALSLTNPADPSPADVGAGFANAFDCGNGAGYSPFAVANGVTCATASGEARIVKGKIRDKDGGTREYTGTLTIENLQPVVTPPADQTADEGSSRSFELGSFNDPGPDGPWTVKVNWGDGSSVSYTAPVTGTLGSYAHTYTARGSYTVTVTVTDNGSPKLSGAGSFTVNVRAVNRPPVLDPIPGQTVRWGNLLTFKATANDPDPSNILTYSLTGTVPAGATIDGAGVFTWTPSEAQGPGAYTANVVVSDNGAPSLSASQAVTISVTKRPTALAYAGKTSGQYSDPVTVTAKLTDNGGGAFQGRPLDGKLIRFTIGTQATQASTDAQGTATGTIRLDQPAGSRNVAASFAEDNRYLNSTSANPFPVVEEEASLDYTGDTLALTPSTGKPANVNLGASVREAEDGSLGDKLGITEVRFSIYKYTDTAMTNPVATRTVPVNAPGAGSGTAAATVLLPPDNYVIAVVLLGKAYYTAPIESVALTVVEPGTGFTTGGGWLAEPNLHTRSNFGFTVKYLKNGNLQGKSLYIYRVRTDLSLLKSPPAGAPAGEREYNWIVRSNAMTGLAQQCGPTTPSICKATFSGKNNITAVDRLTSIPYDLGGNYQFKVDVTDNGEPGSRAAVQPDSYAIRVWDSAGIYYVLGTYNGTTNTVQVPLSGGNIQVHPEGGPPATGKNGQ